MQKLKVPMQDYVDRHTEIVNNKPVVAKEARWALEALRNTKPSFDWQDRIIEERGLEDV